MNVRIQPSYPQSPEVLLRLLQGVIKHPKQTKQVHSLLITNGHLLFHSNASKLKWMPTLLYNSLIRAYLDFVQPQKTLLIFTHMLSDQAPPNNLTFPSIIKKAASCSPSLAFFIGTSLHTQVVKRGLWHDLFIQTSLVVMYARVCKLSDARLVFEEISRPCVVACNAMLDALGKNGDMGSALFLFERMPERDVVSWTSIINGFWSNRCFPEAIQFFVKMMEHKDARSYIVKPNEATFVSVLSSCTNLDGVGALHHGKQVHGYIVRNEVELTVFMATSLITLYGKMGCLETAMKIFKRMAVKGVCAWNAMISCLACNGREKQALDLFEKMKMRGPRPDKVTFVAVITACSRSKSVELGLRIFQSMRSEYGVGPEMEHYGCVVDLLGRAGLLQEATEFIKGMPFEADATVLGAVLGACNMHGAIELGNEVGRSLLQLQPHHCGRYVTLSNICAGAEIWGHAADWRKAMAEAGISKIPAYSMIDSM